VCVDRDADHLAADGLAPRGFQGPREVDPVERKNDVGFPQNLLGGLVGEGRRWRRVQRVVGRKGCRRLDVGKYPRLQLLGERDARFPRGFAAPDAPREDDRGFCR
jgi:hypothetical protein